MNGAPAEGSLAIPPGAPALAAGEVRIRSFDLGRVLSGPGTYRIRYDYGTASNEIVLTLK